MLWCLHFKKCHHFWYLLFWFWNFQYLCPVILHLLAESGINLMALVVRCFSWAFSSLLLHVLTHGFDFMCSWLCVISQLFWLYWKLHMLLQVWTCLLQVSYLWQFQVVSALDICVLKQPKQALVKTNFLLLDMMLFVYWKCCLCLIYWYSILVCTFMDTCVHCFLSNMFAAKWY